MNEFEDKFSNDLVNQKALCRLIMKRIFCYLCNFNKSFHFKGF